MNALLAIEVEVLIGREVEKERIEGGKPQEIHTDRVSFPISNFEKEKIPAVQKYYFSLIPLSERKMKRYWRKGLFKCYSWCENIVLCVIINII